MNTEAQIESGFPLEERGVPDAPMAETRPLYWSVRRELWEHRAVYIAPLIVAAVVLFATLIATIGLPKRMRATATTGQSVAGPVKMAPAPIMLASLMVGVYYCLDALYGERRDRSILFWKSLPVSDRTIVLSKAAVPVVVLPLIAYVLSVAIQIILVWAGTSVLIGSGISPVRFWTEVRFFEGLVIMFYGLAVHVLWYTPIYGWLLLVSAWARRAPFLWAVVPLFAISVFERVVFDSMHFMGMLQYRVGGALKEAFDLSEKGGGDIDRLSQLDPAQFFTRPGLWLGLIFAALCVALATRLRRNREPI